jgi:hypothetical protein|tara:strand:+ start:1507 stop:2433 length:927 start_codon:yes stop_codon:yes gene_type:complete
MPIFVKDAGQWREISSSTGGEVFLRDGTSYTNKTINNIYVKDNGTWREVYSLFETTSFVTVSTAGSSQISVPANANAIHIQQAVGGGAGGVHGADYDKAGGESGGTGGGSGAYISDRVYSVVGGEQLTINVGASGSAGNSPPNYNVSAGSGTVTNLSGGSTGLLFSLAGGGGGSASGGGVQGPLRSNSPSSGGTATLGSSLSSGTTVDGLNITTFNSGPNNTFNSGGAGVAGVTGTNCGGDNCTVAGGNGADSYNGNINGGSGGPNGNTGGSVGTQGSGGGGGGAEPGSSNGAVGGVGEMVYRFLRIA